MSFGLELQIHRYSENLIEKMVPSKSLRQQREQIFCWIQMLEQAEQGQSKILMMVLMQVAGFDPNRYFEWVLRIHRYSRSQTEKVLNKSCLSCWLGLMLNQIAWLQNKCSEQGLTIHRCSKSQTVHLVQSKMILLMLIQIVYCLTGH
jgi:hypothetical protein